MSTGSFAAALGIQAGLSGGANETFLYERNAPAVPYYHHTIARLMAALAGEDSVSRRGTNAAKIEAKAS